MEIPEGSNSAKARRSDVVGSDDLDIHRKPTQFHEASADAVSDAGVHAGFDAKDQLAYSASLEEAARRHQEEVAHSAKDQLVSDLHATAEDKLPPAKSSVNPDNLAHLPATDTQTGNLQALPDEALRDRFAQSAGGAIKDTRAAGLGENKPLADRFGHEANSGLQDHSAEIDQQAIKDRLTGAASVEPGTNRQGLTGDNSSQTSNVGIAEQALKDNLQGVANEALKDNHQGLDDEALKDNLQGVANEALKDNHQGLDDEALKDNLQAVANEALKDNHQGLDDEALKDNLQGVANEALKDNLQGVGDEALKDNQQGVANEALKDNLQGVADEALKDNQQGLADEALKDNHQPLGDSAVATRKDTQDKEHVQDHIVNLPQTQGKLASGPSPAHPSSSVASDTPSTAGTTQHVDADHPGTAAHASQPAHTPHVALSKAEHAKRMEEFHGRVEAIRKSVSGINHLLDDLQDKH